MPDPTPAPPRGHRSLWGTARGALQRFRRRTVRTRQAEDHVVVRLSGEITATNAERVGKGLRNALRTHPRIVEVDLQRVTFMASDGGRAFLPALLRAQRYGTRVIVTHASAQARTTFQRLGLTHLLDIHEEGAPENGTPDSQSP
ncbi:STAS domain-containing protein [Streptomyces sp. CG1]|uniref:STAS domain-containing protein n=1 Tax=Streptomyces sp. CG1 TaxID=1287523 RepID=UPI0034E1CF17